tara:strand:+ start:1170 stop:1763 length:594 start_codon:yes stop_codon:yes gene_type:complete
MINYFTSQKINWYRFSPKDIIFKSNSTIKKLMPEENILSYTSKGDRDTKTCKLTGGKATTSSGGYTWYSRENYKAVHVHLEDLTKEYPQAKVQFIDYTNRANKLHKYHIIDTLSEIRSMHYDYDYDSTTRNYTRTRIKNLSDQDGYEFTIGGQGQGVHQNLREWMEMGTINQSIINFLAEMVIPLKQGTLNNFKICA